MNIKIVALTVGLWLGFVWMAWSFGDMVLVALAGIVGWAVGSLITGDLDLERFTGPIAGRAGRSR